MQYASFVEHRVNEFAMNASRCRPMRITRLVLKHCTHTAMQESLCAEVAGRWRKRVRQE